ncbi:MAG: DUF5317 domain-containing protein [Anaerolineae bacterium]
MILAVAVILSFAIALVRSRGHPARISDVPMHMVWLAFLAFGLQLVPIYGLGGQRWAPFSLMAVLLLLSYALLFVFIWYNRHLPGMKVIALGVFLNFLVLVANGGFMPIAPEALTRLGRSGELGIHDDCSKDIPMSRDETRLWLLSDIFVFPPPFPLPTAVSLGDVLLALGAFIFSQKALLSPSSFGSREP